MTSPISGANTPSDGPIGTPRIAAHSLALVAGTVLLAVVSAVTLKEAADAERLSVVGLGAVLALVLGANIGRFVLWGLIYRSHPVTLVYPLGATFFPLVLLIGWLAYGEALTPNRVLASLMIMVGVSMLSREPGVEPGSPDTVSHLSSPNPQDVR